ncbi:RloB family protein [Nocardia bovistercoris]|uniref:RloB domain-containing protein n=1 Tax=Nocardia bovistercoris TaxID=2785916 RepID=A0A931I914_9NOCA|nr:RloB family protein [Nocardia bovistercoris]MBH0775952.1 RloB domain-containing protein [Nocardia bovistercoris]
MKARKEGGRTGRPKRQPARRILVVTEGTRTEPQYVEGLNRYLRSRGTTAVVKSVPVGKDPIKVVLKGIEIRDKAASDSKDYDVCVCLVDVDQHEGLPAACRLAARESILLLVSNLKFEAWLRWHAEDKHSALSTSQLDDLTAKLGLITKKMLAPTFPFHAVHGACEIARRVDPDLEAGRSGSHARAMRPVRRDYCTLRRNSTTGRTLPDPLGAPTTWFVVKLSDYGTPPRCGTTQRHDEGAMYSHRRSDTFAMCS